MKTVLLFSVLLKIAFSLSTDSIINVFDYADESSSESDCSETAIDVPIQELQPAKTLENLSICLRFVYRFQAWMTLLSFKDVHNIRFGNFQLETGTIGFNRRTRFYQWKGKLEPRPDNWINICYNLNENGIWVVMDGKLLNNDKVNFSSKIELSSDYLAKEGLKIGIRDVEGKLKSRFSGLISDINIWSWSLSIDEMIQFNNEPSSMPQPDLLDWNNVNKTVNSECIKTFLVRREDLVAKGGANILYPIQTESYFNIAKLYCQAFGGEMFLPKNDDDLEKLKSFHKKTECRFWIGGRKAFNGDIYDMKGNHVTFSKWYSSEPNGGNIEQCIASWISKDDQMEYFDFACDAGIKNCYVCEVPSKQAFTIRGENEQKIDSIYQANLDNVPLKIRGLSKSEMEWIDKNWVILDHAWTNWSISDLPPFGTNIWTNELGKKKKLLFVQESSEKFACHTHGNMIPMSKRCNGVIDCPFDSSDEQKCNIFELPSTYVKSQNPFEESSSKSLETVTKVSFRIENIFQINEIDMEFKVRIEVKMKWFDSRIIFRNLHNNSKENVVPLELHNLMWKPVLFFLNSHDGQRTLADSEASVTIGKQGNFSLSPLNEMFQDYFYKGSENPLEIRRFYTVSLFCPFQMRRYPFDFQACPITLEVPLEFENDINITTLGQPIVKNEIILPQFEFQGLSHYILSENQKRVTIFINLQRNFWNHLITTFVPTICLVIIAELTLFIDLKHFNATIMLSLTTMLVMYSLYQRISEELPMTTYMKMIDIWLFGGIIIPFVVLNILIWANSYESTRSGSKILKKARFFLPFTTIILVILFILVKIATMP